MIEIKNRWNGELILKIDKANLIGADLSGADLSGANLYGANLRGADLRGANLRDAGLVIYGLLWYVQITKNHMRIGCKSHNIKEWEAFSDEQINDMDSNALEFWSENKELLLSACQRFKKED